MITFAEIYGTVSDKIQKSDSTFQTKIKRWVNLRYETLAKRHPWAALFDARETGVTLVSGSAFLILPKRVGSLFMIAEMTNKELLDVFSFTELWRQNTDTINSAGNAVKYSHVGEVGSAASLSIADKVQVVSSSASDNAAFSVRIFGTVSGEDVAETINLNGTTAVDSVNTYDSGTFIRVSKNTTTTGVITIREKTTPANVLAKLVQNEFTVKYKRLRLHLVPNSAPTVAIYYNKQVMRLVNDLDVPEFDCGAYLVAAAYADALKEQKQYAKAIQEEKAAENELAALMIQEMFDDGLQQLTPKVV